MANGGLILDYLVMGAGLPTAYSFPGGSTGVPSLGSNSTEMCVYLDTTNDNLYAWDGSAWHDVTGGGASALASAKSTRTSGDITVTSTTFADLDTGLDLTITTGARRCLVIWTVNGKNSGSGQCQVDVAIDGTRQGQTFGLVFQESAAANANVNLSGSHLTDALTAGSHTFKLMGRVDANTGTFYASTSITPIVFSVVELNT